MRLLVGSVFTVKEAACPLMKSFTVLKANVPGSLPKLSLMKRRNSPPNLSECLPRRMLNVSENTPVVVAPSLGEARGAAEVERDVAQRDLRQTDGRRDAALPMPKLAGFSAVPGANVIAMRL